MPQIALAPQRARCSTATLGTVCARARTDRARVGLRPPRPSVTPVRALGAASAVSAAAPAAATAPAVIATFWGKSVLKFLSGEQLEATFMALPVRIAAREAALLIVISLLVATFGTQSVRAIDGWTRQFMSRMFKTQDFGAVDGDGDGDGTTEEQMQFELEETRARRNVFIGLLEAVSKPLEAIIPVYCSLFSATVALTIGKTFVAKIAIPKNDAQLRMTCAAFKNLFAKAIDLVASATELVIVVLVAWTLLRLKDKILRAVGEIVKSTDGSGSSGIDEAQILRFLQPLSTLLTWAVVIGATMSSLIIVGVDIGPMLAVGGASTLAIGLAAQSTVSNLVAALSLYTSRTFIKGDRVQFKSMSGSTVVAGTVLDIQPLKTLVKTDNGSLTYVNNKDLAMSLMVVNESLESRTKLSGSIPVLNSTIIVAYADIDKVRDIVDDIDDYLQSHPDMDSHLSRGCMVEGFSTDGVHLLLKGTMAPHARSKRRAVYTDIFLSAERIVRGRGAYLSADLGYKLPPRLDGSPARAPRDG